MKDIPAKPRIFEESGETTSSKYWKEGDDLIMQAGEGRYDLARGFDDGLFGEDVVADNPKLGEIMKKTMVEGYTSYGGVVHSEAGSSD